MTDPASPFDDIRRLIATMPGPDEAAAAAVRERDRGLVKPAGSLGRLEWLAEWLAAWQAKTVPSVDRPLVCVFAASHGIAGAGAPDRGRVMLETFAAGGGAINQVCASLGLGFKVFDLAIDIPTGDIRATEAMDEKACVATMAFGMEAIAGGADLLGIGESGVGNRLVAAAVFAALYGGPAERWVGEGEDRADRAAIVEAAVAHHRAGLNDPLEILRRVGGREIAAIAGAILAARLQRIPVILDGYAATAAAAILHAIHPATLDHCVAGHLAADPAHREVLERLAKIPLLALGLGIGEGTGAALAMGIVKAAAAVHRDMATLAQAGLPEPIAG
ncbi:MAG TPA: nicotinate-nucleotide--dimethylbenzimidazole phosphoribosyltransferase [Microvirga sp.]|jgi:nicotinate-nucleotide--dimethylbenzimidazole phosphoribosyltransferase|nr:nicotinate-nucleotide--dimethylbenzimidazole phosphoribosyltransferase [Microvirga sp.]